MAWQIQEAALLSARKQSSFNVQTNKQDEEYEPGRNTIYSHKNQPMSLELKYKRSVPSSFTKKASSKSVNNSKKGILKKSSSFISSGKKKPVQFKKDKKSVEANNLRSQIMDLAKSDNAGKHSAASLKKGISLMGRLEDRDDLPKFKQSHSFLLEQQRP